MSHLLVPYLKEPIFSKKNLEHKKKAYTFALTIIEMVGRGRQILLTLYCCKLLNIYNNNVQCFIFMVNNLEKIEFKLKWILRGLIVIFAVLLLVSDLRWYFIGIITLFVILRVMIMEVRKAIESK